MATQIEVISQDRTLQAPVLGLEIQPLECLSGKGHVGLIDLAETHYYEKEIDCDLCKELEANSWDIWNQTNLTQYKTYDFDVFYEGLSLAFVEKLLSTSDGNVTTTVLDPMFSSWNQPILAAAIKFFYWQGFIDFELNFPRAFPNQPQSFFEFNHERFLKRIDTVSSNVWNATCQNVIIAESSTSDDDFLENISENTTCENIDKSTTPTTFFTGLTFQFPPVDMPKRKNYQIIFNSGSFVKKKRNANDHGHFW